MWNRQRPEFRELAAFKLNYFSVCETHKKKYFTRLSIFSYFFPLTLNFLRAIHSTIVVPCFSVFAALRSLLPSPSSLPLLCRSLSSRLSPRLFHALSHPLSHLHLILLSLSFPLFLSISCPLPPTSTLPSSLPPSLSLTMPSISAVLSCAVSLVRWRQDSAAPRVHGAQLVWSSPVKREREGFFSHFFFLNK